MPIDMRPSVPTDVALPVDARVLQAQNEEAVRQASMSGRPLTDDERAQIRDNLRGLEERRTSLLRRVHAQPAKPQAIPEGIDADEQSQDEAGQTGQGAQGDARVQARSVAQQQRPQGQEPQAGDRDSHERVGAGPQVQVLRASDKRALDKAVKQAARGKALISRTDRVMYEAVIVLE